VTGRPVMLVRPIAPLPVGPRIDPAPRPPTLADRIVHLILSLPHGSGMESEMATLAAAIRLRFGASSVVEIVRKDRYMADDPVQRAVIAEVPGACVVYFGSPTGALNLVGARYCAALEAAGVPTLLIVPSAFVGAVDHVSTVLRCPLARLTSDTPDFTNAVIAAMTTATAPPAAAPSAAPELNVNDEAASHDIALREGWGDGLPLILPTVDRVAAMLRGAGHSAETIVQHDLGPDRRTATVRLVAANAVMAGARSIDLPLLLAMTEALGLNPDIRPMLSSVNGFCFPFVVNGPIRDELGLESGCATLDADAHRAVERAIHLIVRNVLGVRPGVSAFPVQGNPAGTSFLIVENEAASPWPPLSADEVVPDRSSWVTLFGGGWSHIGTYFYPDEDIDGFAAALARLEMPHSVLVLLSPGRARLLAEQFGDKAAVAEAIRLRALIQLRSFRRSGYYSGRIRDRIINEGTWPADYLDRPDDDWVPAYPPGAIRIVVCGSNAAPIMTAWKLERLAAASPDAWRALDSAAIFA
jgi:hypothetical protein